MKNFEVLWTKSAKNDLELIIEYIKLDSEFIAKEIFFELKKYLIKDIFKLKDLLFLSIELYSYEYIHRQ